MFIGLRFFEGRADAHHVQNAQCPTRSLSAIDKPANRSSDSSHHWLEPSDPVDVGGFSATTMIRSRLMVRKQFLLSTATICLMLASGLVYAQAPDSKKDDTQKERVQKNEPAKGAEPRSDVKGQEKSSEHTGAKDQKTPAASVEKDGASKHDQKDRAGNEGAKQNDQAGDSRHGSKDAVSEKSAQEKSAQEKSAQEKSAQEKSAQEKSAQEKSAQDSQKSKTGESKSGAASTERPQNQNQAGETSKTGAAPAQQTA